MAQKGIFIDIGGNTAPLNKALSSANKTINATQRELNQVNKLLKLDPSNTELLAQRQTLLKNKISDTETKVTALKNAKSQADEAMKKGTEINQEEYRRLEREIVSGENSLKDLKTQSALTEVAIEKSAKGGQVEYNELTDDIKKTDNAADKASKGGFTVMKGALANLASVGIQKAIGGLKSLATKFTEIGVKADDLNTLSKQTGISTDDIQKMEYASDIVDVSVEDITGSLRKMKKNMVSTSTDTIEAWKTLGVATADASGNSRNATDVFYETLQALSQIPNETERDQLAMQLFGKSADNLAGIVDDGGSALRQLGEEAENAGVIMSEDTLAAANEFNNGIDKLKATAIGAFAQIGGAIAGELAPQIEELANQLSEWMKTDEAKTFINNLSNAIAGLISLVAQVITWIVENKELVGTLAAIITGIAIAVGVLNTVLAIQSAIMMANPITWIVAAIVALIAIITLCIKHWDEIKAVASNVWEAIKEAWSSAAEWFGGIFNGIVNAVRTAFDWIKNALKSVANFFIGIGNGIISGAEWIVNKIIEGVNWGIQKINAMLSGISSVLSYIGIDVNWQIPTFSAISIPRIPTLWKGGIVNDGAQAIVGDKGPERLTVQNGKAVVTPLNAMKSSATSGSESINVNISEFNNYDTEVDTNKLADTVAKRIEFQTRRVARANG